jgi:hypothetical protein
VPLTFDPAPTEGALLQGEILANVREHRVIRPAPPETPTSPPVFNYDHDYVIVLSAGCDLEWDFNARFARRPDGSGYDPVEFADTEPKLMPYTLCCSLFSAADIRLDHKLNASLWSTVRSNNNKRYHYLAEATGESPHGIVIPESVLDFKQVVSINPGFLYQLIKDGSATRVAVVPPIYIHDIMQRFYAFLARVGLPD